MAVNLQSIVPNLCLEGYSPLLLCGWTIQYLRAYFANGENLEHQAFRSRLFAPDTETGLWIGSVGTFLPQLTEKRPVILVRHGAVRTQPLSIGMTNVLEESGASLQNAQYVQDTVVVQCLARSYDETMILGWEALSAFLKLAREVGLNLPVRIITASELGQVASLDESRQIFATGFPVQYDFILKWTTTKQEI